MNYSEFNKLALEYYSIRSKSSFCTLSIDSREMELLIPISSLSKFHLLRSSWEHLLNRRDGIPQYFGLIAIQCLAASLMQNDENSSSDAYQIRLRALIGLADNSSLQALFKGDDAGYPTQEIIWYSAKEYLYTHLKLTLDIPERTKNAWRYVRYPISQALLNTEDLKYFTSFFQQEFQVGEDVPFNYFEQRLKASIGRIKLTNRAIYLLTDYQKQEKCIRQVYDSFYSWNGTIYNFNVAKKESVKIFHLVGDKRKELLLKIENNTPAFYLFSNSSNYEYVDIHKLFRIDGYNYYHSELLIFNEIDYYPNEYESSRFIHSGNYCYIVIKKEKRVREYNYLTHNSINKYELESNIWLFKYLSDTRSKTSCLGNLIQNINPIKLSGGIRVNRKREYLKGYGPSIIGKGEYTVIYNHMQYDYIGNEALCGTYKLRVNNFRDIEFSIVDSLELTETIMSRNKGWHLSNYTISNVYDIEGAIVMNTRSEKDHVIRTWIDYNNRKKQKYKGRNNLIKAINSSTA